MVAPVWVDNNGRHLASIRGMGLMREGYQEHFQSMRDMQEKAAKQAATTVARRFLTEDARRPLLIDNVRLFDAEAGEFHENQAVTTENGKIAAVGPAGSLTVPAGGRVAKTLKMLEFAKVGACWTEKARPWYPACGMPINILEMAMTCLPTWPPA